jgi:Carboxypeptidase regulatory-like domain/TonB dependent receptor/TonB-dependent Receptor Plug Domain
MKRAVPLSVCVCVFGLLALFVMPIGAQDTTGRVIGSVADPQGGAVPGAKVTVTNSATRQSSTTTTEEDGSFEVLNLPIGRYSVTVERQGFNKVVTQENKLEINQSLRFDITLTLGAVSETVTVEAQTSRVETVNPTVGATVSGDAIQQAPLNGRNVLNLALLEPGVTESNPDNTAPGNYSIAGGRTDSVTYLLDGSLNNNLLDNSVVFNPNPDTIEEFRVLESNYSAEYGRNGGGIITEETKSGTNQWHGSAFDYLRNGDLDANSYFNRVDSIINGTKIARDPLRRNQYGGTFGGPIKVPHLINGKDRFFFFVGYQGQKQSDLETPPESQVPVLTTAEAKGDFSQAAPNGGPDPNVTCFLTGFWNNNPNEPNGSPCGTPANPAYAAPTQPGACAAFACALNPALFNPVSLAYITDGLMPVTTSGVITPRGAATDNDNELTMRFDFQVTPKDQLTATLGGERNPNLNPFVTESNLLPWATVPGFSVTTKLNEYFVNLTYTRTISPDKLNELRFSTQRQFTLQGIPVGPNALLTAKALGFTNLTPDDSTGPPLFDIDQNTTSIGYTYGGPSSLANNTFGVSDAFTWIRGKHNWKMGGGISAYENNQLFDFVTNGLFDFDGTLTGNGYADFLLGAPSDYLQGAAAPSNIRTKSTYGFFQDEWHATKKLTLTLGVRYEYNSPKSDTLGRTFSIVPGDQSTRFPNAPVGLVFPDDKGAPSGVNFPDTHDWAPRFGFAWNPDGAGKTSVRGGFGIFYDILKAEDNFQFNGQPPFFSLADFGFPTSLTGNSCPASNESGGIITYFSDPFDSTCNTNTFPSVPQLKGTAYFSNPGSLPFGGQLFFVDPHLHTPYTYQYNLSVQHQFLSSLTFEADYVGSSSHGLTSLQDVNPFVLGTTNRVLNLDPGDSSCADANAEDVGGMGCTFAALDEFRNIVDANYNALTASVTKRMGDTRVGALYFTAAYTWGHNIDNASGFRQRSDQVPSYDPELLRASGDTDVRNRVSLSGGWDIPFDRAWASGPKRLTQGWTLFPIFTWRSGFPLNVFADLASDLGSSFAEGPSGAGDAIVVNANVVGPLNTGSPGQQRTVSGTSLVPCQLTPGNPLSCGNYWFNPTSFNVQQSSDTVGDCSELATEAPGTFPSDAQAVNCPSLRTYGTFRRNSLRGPDLVNLDMSLSKTTAITERLKLEIRGDFFNLLNHAEFANPDTNPTDVGPGGTFGQITNTGVPGDERERIIQIAARFSF